MKKILITGGSGLIGSVLNNHLKKNYSLSNLDIKESSDKTQKTIIGDINNFTDVKIASENMDVIIHLGAVISVNSSWEDVLKNNIESTRNIYESAKVNGVKKVIFASSNHTVGLFENDSPYKEIVAGEYNNISPESIKKIDENVPLRPDSYYGVSKSFGESIGRYYFETFGIQSVNLRIGTVQKVDTPKSSIRHFSTWLSHKDISQLVEKSIIHDVGFEIFYGVSNNKWRIWDINNAYKKISYMPIDNAENFRD
ncbi:MAG: NAD-dependent epimerase/dehydratase family protein [Dehalococcoidales bacterium]|jgi:nucleoside-diphosphate-sugar epimerase|nr:NAD(P)-dependent oxidoreductase [Dehalococcoidia bacterium]NCG35657.1 NAD-dependent epimerase/dehydratase family protein [Dehalococcoidales bacterium]